MTSANTNVVPSNCLRCVYIVDDDPIVRRSTSFLLKSAGFEARAFRAGTDFLDELPMLQPGATLLDVRMPDIDGLSVLRAIPDNRRAMFPVIVITGHGDLPTAVQAMKLGAKDFLEKPFAEDALFDILAKIFSTFADDLGELVRRNNCRDLIAALSPRERDVLRGLMRGDANKLVAHQLGLSVRTVETHRAKMLERLGVRTLPDALRLLFLSGVEL
jgi:two-component system response regulator FixJ